MGLPFIPRRPPGRCRCAVAAAQQQAGAMPLYDLMAIVRPAAPRAAVAEVLRRAAVAVLDAGGVVTDVKSFGTRPLAYEIKRAGELHKEVRARARCGHARARAALRTLASSRLAAPPAAISPAACAC